MENIYVEDLEVGHINLVYFNISRAVNDRVSIMDEADADSQELYDYISACIFRNEYVPKVKNVIGEDSIMFKCDVLIMTQGEIDPKYRGHKIMLKAMRQIIQQIGYEAVTIIKPFALQFCDVKDSTEEKAQERENSYNYTNYTNNMVLANKTLQKYYGKLGFKKLRNSEYMVITQDHLTSIV